MRPELKESFLLMAYSQGYFPMPHPETNEIQWYRPEPRAIIPLDGFHLSRSLRRSIRKNQFEKRVDTAFREVMQGCADREETWITDEFKDAYYRLFLRGNAHSIEVWKDDQLVGGVYGVSLGGAFFAESKFHSATDASKAALYFLVNHLREKGFSLLEVQFLTPHLESLGAVEVSDAIYQKILMSAVQQDAKF